jgi:hypothetical protein
LRVAGSLQAATGRTRRCACAARSFAQRIKIGVPSFATAPKRQRQAPHVASSALIKSRRPVLTYLIDRRLQGKNKSAVNRERFLRRYKAQIKDAVGRAIKGRSITDIENGEKVTIPVKDVNEPHFGHAHGGVYETVNPGNTEYQKGDQFNRPRGGASWPRRKKRCRRCSTRERRPTMNRWSR